MIYINVCTMSCIEMRKIKLRNKTKTKTINCDGDKLNQHTQGRQVWRHNAEHDQHKHNQTLHTYMHVSLWSGGTRL